MNPDKLVLFCPDAGPFFGALQDAFTKFALNTLPRQQQFLAQCAHESAGFARLEENLHYSAGALMRVWPTHFPDPETAAAYANQPERIANRAYAGRNGNGDEASGDGWRFRGRGLFQITGLANYGAASSAVYNDDRLVQDPDSVAQPGPAVMTAGWFWDVHGLNRWADLNSDDGYLHITRSINGGVNGLADRIRLWRLAQEQVS